MVEMDLVVISGRSPAISEAMHGFLSMRTVMPGTQPYRLVYGNTKLAQSSITLSHGLPSENAKANMYIYNTKYIRRTNSTDSRPFNVRLHSDNALRIEYLRLRVTSLLVKNNPILIPCIQRTRRTV